MNIHKLLSEILTKFKYARKWGVSATPSGRFDGRDKVIEGLFGPVVYQRTYAQGISDGALVPIKVYWVYAPEPTIGLEKLELSEDPRLSSMRLVASSNCR